MKKILLLAFISIFIASCSGLDSIKVTESEYKIIAQRIIDMRDKGAAILLVSVELDEILSLSDRIGVIFRGKLAASMRCQDADRENLGLLMGRGEL